MQKLTLSVHHTQSGDSRIQSAHVLCARHLVCNSESTIALETVQYGGNFH